jgi:hypothetical protein
MRSTFFVSAAILAVASAQSSSVDPFPQTNQLTQTNSLGVVTGQPAVATSQPALPPADTVQPPAATDVGTVVTIPAVGTGLHTLTLGGVSGNVNGTRTITVSANNSTTLILGATNSASITATGSGASGSGKASGSPTGSGSPQQSTNAAIANAVGGFAGMGALLAAFL